MRIVIWAAIVVVIATGCHHPPLARRRVRLATVPFEYGTNASLVINQKLKRAGAYKLYLLVQKAGIPPTAEGNWPDPWGVQLRVFVLTNGVPAIDQRLDALHFNSSHDPQYVRYALTVFLAGKGADVTCRITDMSDRKLKVPARLIFERTFPK